MVLESELEQKPLYVVVGTASKLPPLFGSQGLWVQIPSSRPKSTKNYCFLVDFLFVKNHVKSLTYSLKRCIVSFTFI